MTRLIHRLAKASITAAVFLLALGASTATASDYSAPLGDGKVSTSSAKSGWIYVCKTAEEGASTPTPWISREHWNPKLKPTVRGSVKQSQALVSITLDTGSRVIKTSGLPTNSTTGVFPIAKSDPAYQYDKRSYSIKAGNYSVSIPLNPKSASKPTCLPSGPIGYGVNGVAIFSGLDDQGRDALAHEMLDLCGGHVDSDGQYHYHSGSNCIAKKSTSQATLIGYALDGFGIYLEKDSRGKPLTNAALDACHGRVSKVMFNGKLQNVYHYVATDAYPYTLGCYKGTPTLITGPASTTAEVIKPTPFIEINPPEPNRVVIAAPKDGDAPTLRRVSDTSVCLNGGHGYLQHLDEDQWVDLAPLVGWTRSEACPAAWPLTPWTDAKVIRGEQLRWRIYEENAWQWFSNPFEYHEKRTRLTPAEKPDVALKDFSKIPVSARNSILGSTTYDPANYWSIQFENSIPEKNRQYIRETVEKGLPFISRFLLPLNQIHIVVFSSREWGLRRILEFAKNDTSYTDQMTKMFATWGDRPAESCIGAGGFTIGYFEHPVIAIDAPCLKWSDESFGVAAHELVHVAQSKASFSLAASCLAPAWWAEGQVRASAWAFAQGDGKSKWYETRAGSMRGILNPRVISLSSLEQPYLKGEYTNGSAAMEYLIARSGWQKSFDLLKEADIIAGRACLTGERRMEVFRQAFKIVYGQTLDDFYREVGAYLAWNYDNVSRL